MNKKLLAVAVGAALASSPMFANAAATVYGGAHLSVDSLHNGNIGADSDITTLASNSSFIGFKAEEDLGGGMKAIFGAEWQVGFDGTNTNGANASGNVSCGTATTGTAVATCTTQPSASTATGIANRNVFVGLQGGFGTVRLGNYDDVMKQVGRKVDLFMNEQLGESRALTRGPGNFMDERLANSVNYETPSFGGVMITGNYGLENSDNDVAQAYTTALGVQYTGGPVYVGAAYKATDPGAGATFGQRAHRISASFSPIKSLRLVGLYQHQTNESAIDGRNRTTWGAGAAFTIGNGTIKGQFYNAGDRGPGAANNDGAHLIAVGYDHALSKTTTVYVTYAQVENETAGAFSEIGAGHMNPQDAAITAPAAKKDPRGTSVGIRMSF